MADRREKILCVGVSPSFDLTLRLNDPLDSDRVNRVAGELREAGGKSLNVARELSRLGVPCGLLSLLGERDAEEYTSAASSGFSDIFFHTVKRAGAVRENLTVLSGDGRTYKINRAGDPVDGEKIAELRSAVGELSAPDGFAVFSGSVPAGMTAEDYAALMRTASEAGAHIAVDTAALDSEQLLGLRPWLYKPNEHELMKLCGKTCEHDADLIGLAREIARGGVEVVLLTMGKRGLAAVTADETVEVPARPVRVVNTVGAGDSALAGFLAEYVRGGDLRRCAEQAADSGAAAVSRAGTGV